MTHLERHQQYDVTDVIRGYLVSHVSSCHYSTISSNYSRHRKHKDKDPVSKLSEVKVASRSQDERMHRG